MLEILRGIDRIIFDFGGVLLALDCPKVISGFSRAAKKNEASIKELVATAPLLQDFEVGKINPQEFREGVNELLGTSLADNEFDRIWNSMLKHLPKHRMDFLVAAGKRFDTYVLSNSNVIHEQAFNRMIKETTGRSSLHEFVKKCYFSQDIGLRKPYASCYQYIIEDIADDPRRMLFLDDRLDNIAGARSVGLRALHILDADAQLKALFGNG